MKVLKGPEGSITLDGRYHPVAIATWDGQADEASIRKFFEWNAEVVRMAADAGGYILITDATTAKRPPPNSRRLIAELTNAIDESANQLSLANYVVLTNPLVRGALTAIQWISAQPGDITYVDTCDEAIKRSIETLKAAGMPVPEGLNPAAYQRPA